MFSRRRGIGGLIIAILVIVVIIVGTVAFVLMTSSQVPPPQSGSNTTTSGTTSSTTAAVTSSYGGMSTLRSNVSGGLQLDATISPTKAAQGSNVSVTAQVDNTLSTQVVVNATSMENPAEGPCEGGVATGVEVYQGTYTSANISAAKQLSLYNPGLTYLCPEVFTFTYTFSPNSDVATIQPSGGLNYARPEGRGVRTCPA